MILAIADLLPEGAVAIDAGANIGLVSIPLARQLGGRGGTVLAFEPQRLIYYMLAGNCAHAGLTNLHCHQLALGREESSIRVPFLDPYCFQDFGAVSLSEDAGQGDLVTLITVDQLGLERLDLIKIDVEEMEISVLLGSESTISKTRPVIWIEVWPKQYAEIFAWMSAHKYQMSIFDDLNFLCLPAERQGAFEFGLMPFDGRHNPAFEAREDSADYLA